MWEILHDQWLKYSFMAKVTVLLVTYNHEKYITRALAGIRAQKFNQGIDILVADDASKDQTVEIIKKWAAENTEYTVTFLPNCENLGITKNYQRAIAALKNQYVAILEGDDYWISPRKISLQIDFLDEHLECDLCAANYYVFEEGSGKFTPRKNIASDFTIVSARELIADNVVGNFSTCLYRTAALKDLPDAVFDVKSYDWIINIMVARFSLIGFINTPLSVYRLHSSGTWSGASRKDKLVAQRSMLAVYDELSNLQFHDDFENLRYHLDLAIDMSASNSLEATPLIGQGLRRRLIDVMPPVLISMFLLITPPIVFRIIRKALIWLKK